MESNPAGQPADMVAEVHDETRDHDGPETDRQRDVIVGRLMKEFRHGSFSECGRQHGQRPGYLRISGAPPEAPLRLPPRTDPAGNDDATDSQGGLQLPRVIPLFMIEPVA
jgi:hypothetical protein